MAMTGGLQRRRRRFHLSLPLRILFDTGRRGTRRSGRKLRQTESASTENISVGGCYFLLSKEPAVGSRLEMEIQMPGVEGFPSGAKLHCWAKVVRVDRMRRGKKVGIACTIHRYQLLHLPAASHIFRRHSPQRLTA
jgi:hypothetical protein